MNISFLNEYCESYLFKYDIMDNVLKDKLVEDIRYRINNLREHDIDMYHMFWDKSKTQQVKILDEYLMLVHLSENPTIRKAILEDENLSETDIFSGIGALIGGGMIAGGGILAAISGMINSLATALGATVAGAGSMIAGIATPIGFMTIAFLLLLLAVTKHGRIITKSMFKTLHAIGKGMDIVGEKIMKQGRDFKFRYAILQKNYEDCYNTAGINQGDIQLLHYLHVGNKKFPITTEKIFEKSKELQKCYMKYSVKSIGLLSRAYFNCLRKTGEIGNIGMGDDIMKMISGTNISVMCTELYDDMKNAFDVYYDLVEFVYGDNQKFKKEALSDLKTELVQSKSYAQKSKFGGAPKGNFNKGGGKRR